MTQQAEPTIWVKKKKSTWVKIIQMTQRAEPSIWVKTNNPAFFRVHENIPWQIYTGGAGEGGGQRWKEYKNIVLK